MLQLVPQPEKISGCGMKGVESGQVLLGKFAMCELSTNNCLCSHFLMLHIFYGVHRYAPCLFFLQFSTYYFCICMCLNASVLVTFSPVVACACVTCACVSESSRGRSSKNDSVSVAVRNSNPLISSQSLLPPSCHCASGIPLGLSPPPVPFEGSYPGNWKLFSNKDKRREKSTDTAKMGSLKGMWWRGLWFKKFFIEVNWILLWVLLL